MSGFDRGLLESKDRNELSQIAEQLGKKPSARAKKADIIDLILTLAGVDLDADADADAEADADGGGAPDGSDAGKGAGSDEASEAGASGASAASEASADSGDDGAADAPAARRSQRGRGPKGDQDGQAPPTGEQERKDDSGQDGDQADQRGQGGRGDQRNQGGQGDQSQKGDQGGQRQGGGQGPTDQADDDQPEDGNRRRRRRGRNRGDRETFDGEPVEVEGLLDLRDDGYGFLRVRSYLPSADDVYVSVKQVRQFGLRKGDRVKGKSRPATRNEKNPALLQVDEVNGGAPEAARDRVRFEDLTPLFPDERLTLEVDGAASNVTTRIIDLLAPIGKGQRGLIVAPPKTGKTTIMKQVARSIELNDPEVTLIVLLVDERPEEVTDMRRWMINGEVAASTFDRPSEEHIAVTELVVEKAKRLVEAGEDVVIILDGITRLARAYNLAAPPSGRIMSGGIDAAALYPPKKIFGAARNAEEGGSLTILATALVETGSRMDEHIFEEFKGTGNMELRLDRDLAERRLFPAIDVVASSTRHEELLFERKQVGQVDTLRKVLGAVTDGDGRPTPAAALELLIDRMHSFKTNAEFLTEVGKARAGS